MTAFSGTGDSTGAAFEILAVAGGAAGYSLGFNCCSVVVRVGAVEPVCGVSSGPVVAGETGDPAGSALVIIAVAGCAV